MKKLLLCILLLFITVVTRAQIVENFDKANVCSGRLPCWYTVLPGGSGGNNIVAGAVPAGTKSLCDTPTRFDISSSLPIAGLGSLHKGIHLVTDSTNTALDDRIYLYSPATATTGDSISFRFRIDGSHFYDSTAQIQLWLRCGDFYKYYAYTQADSGIIQTIGGVVDSTGGGTVSLEFHSAVWAGYQIINDTTVIYNNDSLIFDLYLDDFYTTGPLDTANTCNSTPLPLTLLSFTGSSLGCTNELKWETANEKAFSHFDVQRSEDGASFNTIGMVTAIGKNVFTDKYPPGSTTYYRLKMVDMDGSYKYSAIEKLISDCNGASMVNISPNPAHDQVTLTGLSGGEQITLTDVTGRHLLTIKNAAKVRQMDLSNLTPGTYMVSIIDRSGNVTNYKLVHYN